MRRDGVTGHGYHQFHFDLHGPQGLVADLELAVPGYHNVENMLAAASVAQLLGVAPEKLQRLFDPVQMVQESLIDVGPAVSQRLIEALGGRLRMRQTRHELAFLVTLPAVS